MPTIKKLSIVSGALFTSLLLIAVALKINHLPGGKVALNTALVGLALVFIPLLAAWKLKKP